MGMRFPLPCPIGTSQRSMFKGEQPPFFVSVHSEWLHSLASSFWRPTEVSPWSLPRHSLRVAKCLYSSLPLCKSAQLAAGIMFWASQQGGHRPSYLTVHPSWQAETVPNDPKSLPAPSALESTLPIPEPWLRLWRLQLCLLLS